MENRNGLDLRIAPANQSERIIAVVEEISGWLKTVANFLQRKAPLCRQTFSRRPSM
jgi:hypothetical protein